MYIQKYHGLSQARSDVGSLVLTAVIAIAIYLMVQHFQRSRAQGYAWWKEQPRGKMNVGPALIAIGGAVMLGYFLQSSGGSR